MADWRHVYLLFPEITELQPEVERGRLVYRARGSNKRISYAQLKKGLVRTEQVIKMEMPDWLFDLSA